MCVFVLLVYSAQQQRQKAERKHLEDDLGEEQVGKKAAGPPSPACIQKPASTPQACLPVAGLASGRLLQY